MHKMPYREAVGSLMYASIATHLNITFAVSTLSQYLENLGEAHWETVKQVFRYLLGTCELTLTYERYSYDLIRFTNADGLSQNHCHAISGYVFLIDGGADSWSSRKQELVTLSTAKAEYVAVMHAAKETIWQ
jgi:hypothetical protein